MSALTDWIANLFGTLASKIKAFFAGPGGQIVKDALANAVKAVGAEAMGELVLMASRQVAGQKVVSATDWDLISSRLQTAAISQGIQTSETLLDYVIGNAVAANNKPE